MGRVFQRGKSRAWPGGGGCWSGGLLLRVDPDRTKELLGEPHTDPFVMRGRRMAGWLRVLPEGVARDADLERWVDLGIRHARTLPRR